MHHFHSSRRRNPSLADGSSSLLLLGGAVLAALVWAGRRTATTTPEQGTATNEDSLLAAGASSSASPVAWDVTTANDGTASAPQIAIRVRALSGVSYVWAGWIPAGAATVTSFIANSRDNGLNQWWTMPRPAQGGTVVLMGYDAESSMVVQGAGPNAYAVPFDASLRRDVPALSATAARA